MGPRCRRLLVATTLSWAVGLAGCSGGGAGPSTPDASPGFNGPRGSTMDDARTHQMDVAAADAPPDQRLLDPTDVSDSEAAPDAAATPDLRAEAGGDAVQPDGVPGTSSPCAPVPGDVPIRNGLRGLLDFNILGVNFEEHEGKRVHVFTRESNRRTPLGYGSAVVQNGRFNLRLPDGYARFSYQLVFYYVDSDGDGRCDEGAGDHPGSDITSGHNPSTNEPLEHDMPHEHVSKVRDERVCDVMNACR